MVKKKFFTRIYTWFIFRLRFLSILLLFKKYKHSIKKKKQEKISVTRVTRYVVTRYAVARFAKNRVCMGIRWQIPFYRIEMFQLVKQNFKILGGRLYSPSLKDLALLEIAELVS